MHSPGENCEADELPGLHTLREFISENEIESEVPETFPHIVVPTITEHGNYLQKGKMTYIAGYIAKKLLKAIKICSQCRKELIGDPNNLTEDEVTCYNRNPCIWTPGFIISFQFF